MDSKDQIKRLGFDAWADNQFVNAIEDFVMPGHGNISVTSVNEDLSILIWWDDANINCTIRAYTDEGWKVYDKSIKNDGR